MALTKRQKEVLDFIAGFVQENGYCPSYEEIARGLELASLATVHKHISVLEAKNYLKRGFNQSRSLELAPRYIQETRRTKSPAVDIPLLGRIAAGAPVEAVEQNEVLNFADFAGSGDTFALEVRGNSMIEDHICDGDVILLERVTHRPARLRRSAEPAPRLRRAGLVRSRFLRARCCQSFSTRPSRRIRAALNKRSSRISRGRSRFTARRSCPRARASAASSRMRSRRGA